jgi:hypothetical protein
VLTQRQNPASHYATGANTVWKFDVGNSTVTRRVDGVITVSAMQRHSGFYFIFMNLKLMSPVGSTNDIEIIVMLCVQYLCALVCNQPDFYRHANSSV